MPAQGAGLGSNAVSHRRLAGDPNLRLFHLTPPSPAWHDGRRARARM